MSTGYAIDLVPGAVTVFRGSPPRTKTAAWWNTSTAPTGKRYIGTFYITKLDGVTPLETYSLDGGITHQPWDQGDLILSADGQSATVYQYIPFPDSAVDGDSVDFQVHLVMVDA